MQLDQLLLISQIITKLAENSEILQRAFDSSDKELFDSSVKAVLELQKKLDFLLK